MVGRLVFATLSAACVAHGAAVAQGPDWSWRHPRPQGNSLVAVAAVGPRGLVAVGSYGTVARSADGGATWSYASGVAGVTAVLHAVAFRDARAGVAAGGGGVVLTTADGGATWTSQTVGTASWFAVAVSGMHAVLVGAFGAAAWSADGGATWTTTTSGASQDLSGVALFDARRGLAAGRNGVVLRTQDGGATWTRVAWVETRDLSGVAATGTATAVAVGRDGLVARTVDAGATWRLVRGDSANQERHTEHLQAVALAGAQAALAVGLIGDASVALRTTDGGRTWLTDTISTDRWSGPLAAALLPAGGAVVVGRYGEAWTRAGPASRWVARAAGPRDYLEDVAFADSARGVAVGGSGTVLRTADGGQSWTAVPSGADAWLDGVALLDGRHGYAVGRRGTLLATADGGLTWASTGSARREDLTAAAVAPGGVVVITGSDGLILSRQGEAAWREWRSPTGMTLRGVAFTSRRGVAVGDGQSILMSNDTGASWGRADVPLGLSNLFDVGFADERVGIAVGSRGTILRTTDGGGEWTRVASGTTLTLRGVLFTDARHGWVTGESGTILGTDDAGVTWRPVPVPFGGQMEGAAAVRDGLILFGDGGTLLAGSALERAFTGPAPRLPAPAEPRPIATGVRVAADDPRSQAPSLTRWASGIGTYSSQASPDSASARQAQGPPNVWPRSGVTARAWGARHPRSPRDWLEVTFATGDRARAVLIYETSGSGGLVEVWDTSDSEPVLLWRSPSEEFADARAVRITLPQPRSIRRLRLVLFTAPLRTATQIDAVGLMP